MGWTRASESQSANVRRGAVPTTNRKDELQRNWLTCPAPEMLNSAPINREALKWAKPYRQFREFLERPTLGSTACEHGGDHAGEN